VASDSGVHGRYRLNLAGSANKVAIAPKGAYSNVNNTQLQQSRSLANNSNNVLKKATFNSFYKKTNGMRQVASQATYKEETEGTTLDQQDDTIQPIDID
jgi:hypothetical protein